MNEARRFIRYLFPGLLFVVLLILYLFVSATRQLIRSVGEFTLGANGGGGILQAGVFILLMAGAGYLFATVYHSLCKVTRFRLRYPDHSGLLWDATHQRGWLRVLDRSGGREEVIDRRFSPSEAWSIMSAYYHARIHQEKFREAHVRIESMNDTLHSLGASAIASIAAGLVWLPLQFHMHRIYKCDLSCWVWFFAALLLAIGISALLITNYVRTGREATNFLDGIAAQFLAEESQEKGIIPLYFPGTRNPLPPA